MPGTAAPSARLRKLMDQIVSVLEIGGKLDDPPPTCVPRLFTPKGTDMGPADYFAMERLKADGVLSKEWLPDRGWVLLSEVRKAPPAQVAAKTKRKVMEDELIGLCARSAANRETFIRLLKVLGFETWPGTWGLTEAQLEKMTRLIRAREEAQTRGEVRPASDTPQKRSTS